MDDVMKILQGISPDELAPPGMWFDGSGHLCPVAILGVRAGVPVRGMICPDTLFPLFVEDEMYRLIAQAYDVPTKVMERIAAYHDGDYEPVYIAYMIALEYSNE